MRRSLVVIVSIPVLAIGLYSLWEYFRLNFTINAFYMDRLGIKSAGPLTAIANWVFRYTLTIQGLIIQATTFFVPLIGIVAGASGLFAWEEIRRRPYTHSARRFYGMLCLATSLAFVGYWIVVLSSWLTTTMALYLMGVL